MSLDHERRATLAEAALREMLRIMDEARAEVPTPQYRSSPPETALAEPLRAQWCSIEQKARRLLGLPLLRA